MIYEVKTFQLGRKKTCDINPVLAIILPKEWVKGQQIKPGDVIGISDISLLDQQNNTGITAPEGQS